jgi:PAS domain S-box-containing protein
MTKTISPDLKDLRKRAEAELEGRSISAEDPTLIEAAKRIHELQVYQFELEMQNESLRLSQVELEKSRSKYANLYDFAPVGYLTLDGRGRIIEANLTTASLLKVERHKLRHRLLIHFLVEEDCKVFFELLNHNFSQEKLRREFRVQDVNGKTRTMLLDILFLLDTRDRKRRLIAMTDITEQKLAEEALQKANDMLELRVLERTADLRHTVELLELEIKERQQMAEALQKSEEGLRSLASQLLTAQETERGRLARELHDDLGQTLLFLRMQLNGILRRYSHELKLRQSLEEASAYLLGAIDKVRGLSKDLSPPIQGRVGLEQTLRELLAEFKRFHDHEMTIEVELDEINGLLPEEANIVIYRITQEFLANVHKHSEATRVRVLIKVLPEKVRITLADNGKGFDLEEIKSRPREQRGLGLASMEERLRMLGSRFKLASRPGKGTRLYFEILRIEG